MIEDPATYPLLRMKRRSRRHRTRRSAWSRLVRLVTVAIGSAAVVFGIVAIAREAAAPDPQVETKAAATALAAGNYSAARRHAEAAISVSPRLPDALLLLARADLALGDGEPAEGALNRALRAGVARDIVRPLLADAWLRQGDTDRALGATAGNPADAEGQRVHARALAASGDPEAATQALHALLATHPDDAVAWTSLGRVRLDAGDVAGADAAAQRAVAIARNDPASLTLRGEIIRGRYGLVAALPWFRAALARDAYYHPALIEYAATLGDLGRYGEMLEATRRALVARAGSPQALYLQAVLAARAGRIELARAMLAKTGGTIDGVPGVVLLDGALSYAAGDYEQAVARWRELVGRQPMNIVARRLLGAALIRSGDLPGALDALRPAALRDDADSYILALVGRAFEATGERDWSARFLDRASRPDLGRPAPFASDASVPVLVNQASDAPNDPSAMVTLVRGMLEDGDRTSAISRAHSLVAVSPGAPAAQLLLGDALSISGRYAPAFDAYADAANLRFDVPVFLRVVEAAAQSGKITDGARALALFRAQNPEDIASRRMLANLQLSAQRWEPAIATLEGLTRTIGARDALLLAQLAYAHAGADDPTAALRYGRRAYAIAPMNATAADAYGWAIYGNGDAAGALPLLRKAISLAPARADIRWHLAQSLAEAGFTSDARAAIALALRDRTFPDRDQALALDRSLSTD
ncbi:MAG: tetratricopeptide repeat protein [Candidatus Sphingomonas colombiensis]|nr:tetratricopeptide repeat protein [Sphingomonas sp.]WEK42702.1 MAG: tetratricopeptide repeat protein [Sphingomonas sp.]